MSVIPAVAFAVLATLVLYSSVRCYRYLFPASTILTSSKSASLPTPVVGKSSAWPWPKINLKGGWPRRLSLSGIPRVRVRVPWSRTSSMDSGVVAPKSKNSKNLGIELLPTTGLPPHPSTLPTPTPTPTPGPSSSHVLVDVGESSLPPTPALTQASTHTSSLPGTPRTPSPPFVAPASYFSAKTLLHPLHHHSRPPSPHTLLVTTTPPKNHKRSRSLGGVPVRRLSNGAGSALRNAVDVDVEMDDLGVRNGHVRDTSREHLLIDFSSSSSSSGKGNVEDDPDISPAASDIGVLSMNAPLRTRSENPYGYGYEMPAPESLAPTTVLPKQVARQVPLVDLEEDTDDSWKWFNDAPTVVPAVLPSLPLGRVALSSKVAVTEQLKTEKLVDLDDPIEVKIRAPEPVSEPVAKLVDVEERNFDEGILVDFSDPKPVYSAPPREREDVTVNSQSDHELHDVPLDVETVLKGPTEILEDPFADAPEPVSAEVAVVPEDPFADPASTSSVTAVLPSTASETIAVPTEQGPANAESILQDHLEESPDAWGWHDNHDPWHGHIADIEEELMVSVQDDADLTPHGEVEGPSEEAQAVPEVVFPVAEDAEEPLEHSPAGVLLPTLVDVHDEEEESIPVLDLDLPIEQAADEGPILNVKSDTAEEEASDEDTPKATPSSLTQELPPWGPLDALPIDEDDFDDLAREATDLEALPVPVTPEIVSVELHNPTTHDDPELLDLPVFIEAENQPPSYTVEQATYYGPTPEEISLVLTNPGGALFTVEKASEDAYLEKDDGQHTPTKTPLAQTPTPPASPPPPSHGLSLSTRALMSGSAHNSRALSPATIPIPALILSTLSEKLKSADEEPEASTKEPTGVPDLKADKENVATPVSSKSMEDGLGQSRPAWSIRAQDAPALGVPSAGYVLGASPRAMKRALSSESQKAKLASGVEEITIPVAEAEVLVMEPSVEAKTTSATEQGKMIPTVDVALPPPSVDTQVVEAPQITLSDSLPGAFPTPATITKVEDDAPSTGSDASLSVSAGTSSAISSTSEVVAPPTRRRTLSVAFASTLPSVRRLGRSPLDVALAMQLRPGLGAGADPAWMVRFLMAMYGWLAVVIAGQDF